MGRTGLTSHSYTSFSLSTTFPTRNLDTEDMAKSLKELQMAPSATVMVLPCTSAISSQDGGLMSLVWLVLYPLHHVLVNPDKFVWVGVWVSFILGAVRRSSVVRSRIKRPGPHTQGNQGRRHRKTEEFGFFRR